MAHNPDIYLLYEYMEKISYTLRIKYRLDAPIDPVLLDEAAQEAIARFPYFSVQVGVDEGGNFALSPNSRPLAVLPEADRRVVLGSDEVNGHLFFISYRDDNIWFSGSHSFCGGFGILFWIKTTLYCYMRRKYGDLEAPKDLKLPGTPVTEGELFFPDPDTLPKDEPIAHYSAGSTNVSLPRVLKYLFNPFAKNNYYYEIDIPAKEFMSYAVKLDGSPYTIFSAWMFKALSQFFKEKKDTFLSARIAADYRNDIGAKESYRDFVRFIHVKYDWDQKNEPIEKLNMRARGALISQNQPELSYERFRNLMAVHNGIDEQPDLKTKKDYASKHSTFRSDTRDTYTISYVGQVDYGGMAPHIKGIYTLTDGDLMLEVNALPESFHLCFQVFDKNRKPLDLFLSVMDQENIPYTVFERKTRYLPKIQLPE